MERLFRSHHCFIAFIRNSEQCCCRCRSSIPGQDPRCSDFQSFFPQPSVSDCRPQSVPQIHFEEGGGVGTGELLSLIAKLAPMSSASIGEFPLDVARTRAGKHYFEVPILHLHLRRGMLLRKRLRDVLHFYCSSRHIFQPWSRRHARNRPFLGASSDLFITKVATMELHPLGTEPKLGRRNGLPEHHVRPRY